MADLKFYSTLLRKYGSSHWEALLNVSEKTTTKFEKYNSKNAKNMGFYLLKMQVLQTICR